VHPPGQSTPTVVHEVDGEGLAPSLRTFVARVLHSLWAVLAPTSKLEDAQAPSTTESAGLQRHCLVHARVAKQVLHVTDVILKRSSTTKYDQHTANRNRFFSFSNFLNL
jgi:hypothetical protein